MRGWFYPRLEGQPPLAVPFGISNATGDIRWDTPQFAGEQSFLVEVGKPGFSEVLRRVTVLVDGCVRIDDAVLQQLAPRTVVDRLAGGTIADPSGRVSIVIPPGALQATSNIGITVLQNSNAIRERLPNNIVGGTAGLYVDVAGVFGEQTTQPVTMRVPNTYNLPLGTLIPFGKVDHNTLEWVDFRNLYGGPPPGSGQPHPALGRVVPDGASGTVIEVQFDHFCTPVCSYCLPIRPPEEPTTPDGDSPPCDGGNVAGSSIVDSREGFLRETVALPGFTEFGGRWGIHLGYASSAAAPSVTMRAQSRYASPNGRPVERTLFRYTIEGRAFEAAYDRSLQNDQPLSHCFWDGRNVLGQQMPTGSYPYTMEITTLNADVPVAIPSTFGGTSIQSFGATYPGQIRTQSTVKRDRIVVVNLRDSAYGAGWSVMEEDRLHIDPDGCLVLTYGNGWSRRYSPNLNTPGTWDSRSGDFSTITYDAPTQTYRRSFTDGEVHTFARSGLLQRRVNRFGYTTTFTYNAGNRLTQITSPTGFYYRFFYDAANRLDRIEDSAARVTQITVNGSGDLTEVFDVLNTRRTFSYDADHRMLTNVGYRGERAEYTYQNGRIVRTRQFDVGGGAMLRERLFSPSSLSGEVVDALARGIGSLGQPLPIVETEVDVYTDGVGGTQLFYRDGEGQLIREDDPLGRRIDNAYFANGLLQSTSRPDGSSTHYVYDSAGYPTHAAGTQHRRRCLRHGHERIQRHLPSDQPGRRWRGQADAVHLRLVRQRRLGHGSRFARDGVPVRRRAVPDLDDADHQRRRPRRGGDLRRARQHGHADRLPGPDQPAAGPHLDAHARCARQRDDHHGARQPKHHDPVRRARSAHPARRAARARDPPALRRSVLRLLELQQSHRRHPAQQRNPGLHL
ncbi:MAG: RHS repeat protein [Planctomycetes bacterium]|nr:RHS repeat protein [Planctomycetota bacterium]